MTDSLSIYCDVRETFFFGPGKTLKAMRRADLKGLRLYEAAMTSPDGVDAWVAWLFAGLNEECKEDIR